MLDIVASYHCMQFQTKLMIQTWENSKKTNFRPDFGPFGSKFGLWNFFFLVLPLLDFVHYRKLSLHAISKKTNEPKLRKLQKT